MGHNNYTGRQKLFDFLPPVSYAQKQANIYAYSYDGAFITPDTRKSLFSSRIEW